MISSNAPLIDRYTINVVLLSYCRFTMTNITHISTIHTHTFSYVSDIMHTDWIRIAWYECGLKRWRQRKRSNANESCSNHGNGWSKSESQCLSLCYCASNPMIWENKVIEHVFRLVSRRSGTLSISLLFFDQIYWIEILCLCDWFFVFYVTIRVLIFY